MLCTASNYRTLQKHSNMNLKKCIHHFYWFPNFSSHNLLTTRFHNNKLFLVIPLGKQSVFLYSREKHKAQKIARENEELKEVLTDNFATENKFYNFKKMQSTVSTSIRDSTYKLSTLLFRNFQAILIMILIYKSIFAHFHM
jgi:hypothetical protein